MDALQNHPECRVKASPSPFLFLAGGKLNSGFNINDVQKVRRANELNNELIRRIQERDYPCIGAKAAIAKKEYHLAIYDSLGTGNFARAFCHDLANFKIEQAKSESRFLSFIACYDGLQFSDEGEFELALWAELSAVSAIPEFQSAWDPKFSDNPEDKNFCFSFLGEAFFVVGMHPISSRLARQFSVPTLVFNLYSQFDQFDEETEFYPMVKANRKKEMAYQGSINPMVEKYAEEWESIQFSGKENPPTWKCPFRRFLDKARVLP